MLVPGFGDEELALATGSLSEMATNGNGYSRKFKSWIIVFSSSSIHIPECFERFVRVTFMRDFIIDYDDDDLVYIRMT